MFETPKKLQGVVKYLSNPLSPPLLRGDDLSYISPLSRPGAFSNRKILFRV